MVQSNSIEITCYGQCTIPLKEKRKDSYIFKQKSELQAWLKEKNISFDETEVKAQLLLKIKQVKDMYQTYVVDEMVQEKGITVVRLPPYHCELNPIELIWAQVKGYVAQNFNLNEVRLLADRILLADAIQNITEEAWQKCIDHVIKEEQKMLKIDGIIDDLVDRFVIRESSSESSEFSV